MSTIPAAAARYLALVHRGQNQWWRYLAGVLVIVLFSQVLGDLLLFALRRFYEYSGMRAFLAANFAVLVELAGVAIAVVLIHRRSVLSLVTPEAHFDWRRAWQGFGVRFALGAVISLLESLWYPGRYRLTFDAATFFPSAAVALCLTPLQSAAAVSGNRTAARRGYSARWTSGTRDRNTCRQ